MLRVSPVVTSSRAEKRGFFLPIARQKYVLSLKPTCAHCIIIANLCHGNDMKFLFDLFPVLLFFAAYAITGDIFTATATTMIATAAQVIYSWLRHKKVDTMLWVSLALITVLGGATLLLHNKTFIQWKPTVLYWVFACVLLGAHWLKKVNFIEKMMGGQISLPQPIWTRLMFAWAVFFIVMGVVNLLVAHSFSEALWVKFKVFGTLGLTFIFVILQSLYLSRYAETDKQDDTQS